MPRPATVAPAPSLRKPNFYPVQVCHLNLSYLIQNKGPGPVLPGTKTHLFFLRPDRQQIPRPAGSSGTHKARRPPENGGLARDENMKARLLPSA